MTVDAGKDGRVEFVKLRSSDGKEIRLDKDIACQAPTIRAMVQGSGRFAESEDGVINLPTIRGKVLSCVVDYLYYLHKYTDSEEPIPDFPMDESIALEVLLASNYLGIDRCPFLPSNMASPRFLFAARLKMLRDLSSRTYEHLAVDVWSFFPPVIPNRWQLEKMVEFPQGFVVFDSDCYTREEVYGVYQHNNGRMVHRIDYEEDGSVSSEPDFLFQLESAYSSAIVVENYLYYVLHSDETRLRKRSLRKKTQVAAVVQFPEPMLNLATAGGQLFVILGTSHDLLRVEPSTLQFTYILNMDDEHWSPERVGEARFFPSFVDAVAKDGQVTQVLYYTGGSKYRLRLWGLGVDSCEIFWRNQMMAGKYRFLPGTYSDTCPPFVGTWNQEPQVWIYDVFERVLRGLEEDGSWSYWPSWYVAPVTDTRWEISVLGSERTSQSARSCCLFTLRLQHDPSIVLEPKETIEVF
ncbi:Transcription elongation factor B (SIII), polypeptide 1 (15kDa, elongin C) [Perkinsus olseni]|uniref:Elongin-C n=1 Tax=Perkinsus olseni TaxID=32597 RepID=A0A7J6Q910_PEROL|nr:Transcription elongation factor B (SIII), polypeptide 1 (15kDa, elongin C) [Perkinsus olseni]